MTSTIRWTTKLRSLIDPRRTTRDVPPPPLLSRAEAVEKIRAAFRDVRRRLRDGLEASGDGRSPAQGDLVRLLDSDDVWSAPPDLARDAVVGAALDIEGHGHRLRDERGWVGGFWPSPALSDAVLSYWQAQGGLPYALQALVASFAHELVVARGSDAVYMEPRRTWPDWSSGPPSAVWRGLRRRLALCAEAEYESARAAAGALRTQVSLPLRCALCYALPTEQGWIVEDVAAIEAGQSSDHRGGWLLASAGDLAVARRILRNVGATNAPEGVYYTLLDAIGPDAVRLFVELEKDGALPTKMSVAQFSIVVTGEVARYFASGLENRIVAQAATRYFEHAPALGIEALEEAVREGRPKAAELLAALRSKTTLSAQPRAQPSGEPAPSDLPRVLVQPPWLGRKARKKPKVIDGLDRLPMAEDIVWRPGEREYHRAGRACPYWSPDRYASETADSREQYYLSDLEKNWSDNAANLEDLFWIRDEQACRIWNSYVAKRWRDVEDYHLHHLLARQEIAALPGFLAMAERALATVVEVLARVRSTRVAPLMARAYGQLVKGGRTAGKWLVEHAEWAAVGLLPAAVGPASAARREAETAIRMMAAHGRRNVLEEVAARYGAHVREALDEVLAHDPYEDVPNRLPKLPLFWNPGAWPPPVLRGSGRPVPVEALDALGIMLAFSSPDDPYVGILDIKKACDAGSLGAFAWALFSAWQDAGSPSKEIWALHALSPLGDDAAATRFAALIEQWSYEGRHSRAVLALRVLAGMGNDAALSSLHRLSQKAKSRPLRLEAHGRLTEVAERRSLTTEQLGDLVVPDLDLDDRGQRIFDFGPRRFVASVDDYLKPSLRAEDGTALKEIPDPGTKDDPEKAREATAQWKVFKKTARELLKSQAARLEMAMVVSRRWAPSEYQMFLRHPVLVRLARRLVWGAYDDGNVLIGTFRVAEDGTLASDEDAAFDLPRELTVGVVHAIELPDVLRQRWHGLLCDYEVIPAFEQLGRDVYVPTEEELDNRQITRLAPSGIPAIRVLSLKARGWETGPVGDGTMINTMLRNLPPLNCEIALWLEPGLYAGEKAGSPDQTIQAVTVQARGTWSEEDGLTVKEMGAVLYSEIVRDLAWLRR